jgi:hypothetical protein
MVNPSYNLAINSSSCFVGPIVLSVFLISGISGIDSSYAYAYALILAMPMPMPQRQKRQKRQKRQRVLA